MPASPGAETEQEKLSRATEELVRRNEEARPQRLREEREDSCLARIRSALMSQPGSWSGITTVYRWEDDLLSHEVIAARPILTYQVLFEGVWLLQMEERRFLPDRVVGNEIGDALGIPATRWSPYAHVERALTAICTFYSVESTQPFDVEFRAAPMDS